MMRFVLLYSLSLTIWAQTHILPDHRPPGPRPNKKDELSLSERRELKKTMEIEENQLLGEVKIELKNCNIDKKFNSIYDLFVFLSLNAMILDTQKSETKTKCPQKCDQKKLKLQGCDLSPELSQKLLIYASNPDYHLYYLALSLSDKDAFINNLKFIMEYHGFDRD